MHNQLKYLWFLVLILFYSFVYAQNTNEIRGVILDKETGKGIPFVTIFDAKTFEGTSSNEDGEFVLKNVVFPKTLVLAHVSYEQDTIVVKQLGKDLQIKMDALTEVLPEVVVGSYANNIVAQASKKIMREYAQMYYGKAIYRQVTRWDGVPAEFQEIVYNTKSNNIKFVAGSVRTGRYAVKKDVSMWFRNTSAFTRGFSIYPREKGKPYSMQDLISENPSKNFDFEIVNLTKDKNSEIAIVKFVHRAYPDFMNGELYINTNDYSLRKIKLKSMDVFVNTHDLNVKAINQVLQVDYNFKTVKDSLTSLDFAKVNITSDIIIEGHESKKLNLNSYAYFYETKFSKPKKIKYKTYSSKENDRWMIDKSKYDPKFWKENPYVKRTPAEEEIIKAFDKDGSFGRIIDDSELF
ncbi:MAG: carboxypeptidase-like regulatory domain-containing protein [Cytophagales bacterium]|nr:MAG: carboxypeptidase-like regulatory domain-containing protein [Cytophagales bacterium]